MTSQAEHAMQTSTPTNVTDGEEDWVLLPPSSQTPTCNTQPPRGNIYIDFQLRSRFGNFSFTAQQSTENTYTNKVPNKLEHGSSIGLQEQSPLFRIPAEIRLEVYEHILRIPTSSPTSSVNLVHRPAQLRIPSSLSLLETCRLILSEAETLFYALNRLSTAYPANLYNSLNSARRSAITQVTLPALSGASTFALLQQLQNFENVKSVYLERRNSARFQDVRTWRVMEKQIVGVLAGMEELEEVKFWTPEMEGVIIESEKRRGRELEEFDGRVCGAVNGRRAL